MRNIGFMGASTAVRLLCGLLTFAVMARELGAADFGRLMTAMAAAVILGLIGSYGFANYALREIGAASRDEGRDVMAGVLSAKLMLGGVMLLGAVAILPWVPEAWQGLFGLMLLARLFDAVTELLNVGFRATGRFASETRVATLGAFVQFGMVTSALFILATPVVAAAAYAAARGLVCSLTWIGQRNYFGGLRPAPWRQGVVRLLAARAYAVDYGLQSLFGQVDSLVLAYFFGAAAVGQYQAGMRLFLGGAQAATVLGNVAIPRLSALRSRSLPCESYEKKAQWAFVLVGMAGGLAFASLPQQAVTFALGPGYESLADLLPWFGLLFFVRLCAASSGVLLTAYGHQGKRAALTALHWVVVATLGFWLLPGGGTTSWLVALIGGNFALSVAYAITLRRATRTGLSGWPVLASIAGGVLLLALASSHAS